jgi:hypothetical protein
MSAIVTPDILARFVVTTLTFEDLANHDGEELGAAINPYAVIGLTIKAVVKTNANVNSSSRGVALKSMCFPPETSLSQIDLRFAKPQGGFGFFYSASRAASLGSGRRRAVDQLTPTQVTALREANVAFVRDHRITRLETNALHAIATKKSN